MLAAVLMLAAAFGLARWTESDWPDSFSASQFITVGLCTLFAAILAVPRTCLAGRAVNSSFSPKISAVSIAAAHFAGALALPVVGNLLAHVGVLRTAGIPTLKAGSIFMIVRLISALTVCIAATIGGFYLVGPQTSLVWPAAIAVAVLICATLTFLFRKYVATVEIKPLIQVLALTLFIQSLMFIAWLVLILPSAQGLLSAVLAAVAITMFAGSVPLGFAGFGPRELGAVAAFNLIGIDGGNALAASLIIGSFALASTTAVGLWGLWGSQKKI